MSGGETTALALFSGGLDSILACRVIMAQGITVKAIKFVTPFFGDELLADEAGYRRQILTSFGIDLRLADLSEPYLKMLRQPIYGYGKNFNPCLDCKILIVATARGHRDTIPPHARPKPEGFMARLRAFFGGR